MGFSSQAAVSEASGHQESSSIIEGAFQRLALCRSADSAHDDVPAFIATPPASSDHGGLPRSPLSLKQSSCLVDVLPPEPGAVKTCAPTTPLSDDALFPSMNLVVGGTLEPTLTSPPRQQLRRQRPNLFSGRLPSFEQLGIAAPHPDRFGGLAFDLERTMTGPGAEPVAEPHDDHELLSAFNSTRISPMNLKHPRDSKLFFGDNRTITNPIRHDVATLTPPAETGAIQYNPMASLANVPLMDSPGTDPGSLSEHRPSDPEQTLMRSPPASRDGLESTRPDSWISGALTAALANLQTAVSPANPLRVLSHALPSPSAKGHVYPVIVDAIHSSTPAQPAVWINLFHAIQGRFNLADLTSPPNTPGPPIGGEDYFTQKVFDSAVTISDYSQDLSSLPRSPRPVVPPSSINVSVVERYIPPTSSNEFSDMFNPRGPSLLVDRLVELSPNNGTLIFIYPTRTGAETFMREYLGPILEPLLRTILVVNNLSSELGIQLGRMAAAHQLQEFDQLRESMSGLCDNFSRRGLNAQRYHDQRSSYTLVHASKERVAIERDTWLNEWWVKQEKPRIRDAMTRYAQEAQKKSSNHDERAVTPTELIQQLLDGVTKRPYPPKQEALGGLEVGVFVIKRSN